MFKRNKYNLTSAIHLAMDIYREAMANPDITYCFMVGNEQQRIRGLLPEVIPANLVLAKASDVVEFNRAMTGSKIQFGMYLVQRMQAHDYQGRSKFHLIVPMEIFNDCSEKATVFTRGGHSAGLTYLRE